jgi:glucan biosynthesis protein
MNNYWETNFKATLGEFYEFDYKIAWGDELDNSEKIINKCHTMNAGVVCFRVD